MLEPLDLKLPARPESAQSKVLSHTPEAGWVKAGTSVRLKVEVPIEKIAVPSLVQLTVDDAREAVRKAGLQLKVTSTSTKEAPTDKQVGLVVVNSQTVGPPAKLDRGQAVEVTAVRYTAAPKVSVPNLMKRELDDARSEVQKLGLTLKVQSSGAQSTTDATKVGRSFVDSQTVAAGKEAAKGTEVPVAVTQYVKAAAPPPPAMVRCFACSI